MVRYEPPACLASSVSVPMDLHPKGSGVQRLGSPRVVVPGFLKDSAHRLMFLPVVHVFI